MTVHHPICSDLDDLSLALYGSFLPEPSKDKFPKVKPLAEKERAGAMILRKEKIQLTPGRKRFHLEIKNGGDRPIQVGSHFPLLEANRALIFDRVLSYGMHLDIAAGTACRFEPGERKTCAVVEIGGSKVLHGGNGVAPGPFSEGKRGQIESKIKAMGFGHEQQASIKSADAPEIDRETYTSMFGPTTGDKVRLADTNLWIEVEHDFTTYGDECKFGGGKVLRDGMGQASGRSDHEVLDLVITNALVVDWSGIFKVSAAAISSHIS